MLEGAAVGCEEAADLGVVQLRVLWAAYVISSLGSAVSTGAIPLIAIERLGASAGAISLMAALTAVATAVIALPMGPFIERQHKQRVLRVTEALSFAALASVIAAFAVGGLSFAQLCVVRIVVAVCSVLYTSSLTALLKQALAEHRQFGANTRLASVDWTTQALGPALGGLLITVAGIVSSTAVDALSFAVAALLLARRFVGEHGASPAPASKERLLARTSAGLGHLVHHAGLRGLFANAMFFSGAVTLASPLLSVFMLTTLHLTALEYSISLGAPCAAGLLGSLLSPRSVARWGERRVLLIVGSARGLFLLPVAFAPRGLEGLAVIVASQSLLLLTAGVFNPVFYTYRMRATPDELMTRVVTAWSVSNRTVTPLFIAAGGYLATVFDVRTAVLISGIMALFSGAFMPWADTGADGELGRSIRVLPGARGKPSGPEGESRTG